MFPNKLTQDVNTWQSKNSVKPVSRVLLKAGSPWMNTQTAYQTAIQFFRNAPYNNGQGLEAYLRQHNEF